MSQISDIRTDYVRAELSEHDAGTDPLAFFDKWFAEALHAAVLEVNAMTLATVDRDGKPHARIVLLKGLNSAGFTFFTNYNSDKGSELEHNPAAALVFFWPELQRQVRVEGRVQKVYAEESNDYFASRPRASRIGAWASPQSQKIASRAALREAEEAAAKRFEEGEVPRPEHWGGYVLMPEKIEFWQGRASRLHDRIVFEKTSDGAWQRFRVAP